MIRTAVVVAVLGTLWLPATVDAAGGPQLRGRVMVDVWGAESREDGVDYPSGTDVRAARIGIFGAFDPAFAYQVEADFAGDDVTLKNAYIRYSGWAPATITVGNHKPQFSLENLTSLLRVTFMERALPGVFAFSETIGASAAADGERWSVAGGLFGETPGTSGDGDESVLAAARASFVPVLDDTLLVHVGIGAYYRHLGGEAGAGYRVRQRPEIRAFSTRLLDTGRFDADSTSATGLEFAMVHGPLSLQAEYVHNRVDYAHGGADFSGAYAYASWFLTGERRPYSVRSGTFGRVTPEHGVDDGGAGAFELALRFSTLDLADGIVDGGTEDNITLGLNWYLTGALRVTANWVYFDVDGSTAAMPFGAGDHRGHALGIRAQLDW